MTKKTIKKPENKKPLTQKDKVLIGVAGVSFVIIIFMLINLLNTTSKLTCNVKIENENGTRLETVNLEFDKELFKKYTSNMTITHTGEFNELASSYYPSFVELVNEYDGVEATLDTKDNEYKITTEIDVKKATSEIFYVIESPLNEKINNKTKIKETFENNGYTCK